MKNLGLATMFLLLASTAALAQDRCACLTTPYSPTVPCFEICTNNLLETASMAQLQTMLGISQETAEKIVNVRSQASGGGSLEKIRRVLTHAEFQLVVDRVNSLSSQTLQEFHRDRLHSSIDSGMDSAGESPTSGAVTTAGTTLTTPAVQPTPTPNVHARGRGSATSLGEEKMSGGDVVVEAIKRLEEERNKALVASDVAAIDALYADDYTSAVAGTFRTKAEVLADLKSGALKLTASNNDETNVRVYGTTAVVTGKTTSKVTDHGVDTSGQSYFTRVYINQNGRWRLVANHSSRLTP